MLTDFWRYINQILNSEIIRGLTNLAVIIGVPYLILSHRQQRQILQFKFSGASRKYDRKKDQLDLSITGLIKNPSHKENTIVEIHRVIWKNSKKNSYLSHAAGHMKVINDNTNSEEKFPLRFKKRQAMKLTISATYSIKGTTEDKLLSEHIEVLGGKAYLPKHKHDFMFEDIDGNYFSGHGQRINMEEANLWWTLENTFRHLKDWNIKPFIMHSIKIFKSKIVYMIKNVFWNIGL